MISQERVRELFDYREDGCLIRKVRTANNACIGDVAGSPDSNGHLQVKVSRRIYMVHRLVWLWHHGYLPEHEVDHVNRKQSDNRIENLREVSRTCNMRNLPNRCDNTSGIKGVCWHARDRRWAAQIKITGRRVSLGYHENFLEAVCHRLAAEQAENWEGCDSCSPAYQYVKEHINCEKT